MFHQLYSALTEKKSVQVAALVFMVCFGIAMAVLDIRRGTLISLFLGPAMEGLTGWELPNIRVGNFIWSSIFWA